MKSRCVHLNQELSNLLPTTISTLVHLKLLFILSSQSCSMSSLILLLLQVSPNILSYAKWLASISCCTFLSVKFTDTTPSPESLFTFTLFNSCNCFDDPAMITCYLHLHKAQTKAITT